jgi:hypothetical protein
MAKKRTDYEVGFGKPPAHTRFAKGRSGNPRGRPKGSRNLATLLEQELNAPVIINENGQRKRVTKLQAAVKQLVNKAASGEPRALQQLLGLNRLLDESAGETALEPISGEFDQQLIRGVLKRMQRKSTKDRQDDAEPI